MKSKLLPTLAGIPVVFLLASCSALNPSSAGAAKPSPDSVSVQVPLGDISQVLVLKYGVLNPDKPYADAVLMLFDNGSYRIASPGEDHYGSYVTTKSEPGMGISFISWPSQDWTRNGSPNVAMHVLTFNSDGTFVQDLTEPGGGTSHQAGQWINQDNPDKSAADASWEELSKITS